MTAKVPSDVDILRVLQESPWETLMRECAGQGEAAPSAKESAPAPRRGARSTRSKKKIAKRDVPAPRPSTTSI